MGISIVPITPVTGSDNPSSQISVNATNTGFQKLTQTSAGLLGATASGDSGIVALTSTQLLVGSSTDTPIARTVTGDVTISNTGVTAIGANKVTLSQMATIATTNILGRTTAGTGNVESLTPAQATALLSAVVGDSGSGGTKGLVPAPSSGDAAAGKFLKADGTFAVPSGAFVPTDYITGMLVTRNSNTSIDISAGAYYDPANSTVQSFTAQTNVSVAGGSPAASTWYAVFVTGSTVTITSGDPPSTTYIGTARKDGSNRRYIGSILTDASNHIIDIAAQEIARGSVMASPKANTAAAPFRMLSGVGPTANWTAKDLTGALPKYVTTEFNGFYQPWRAAGRPTL
jgi:hypothetical protein